MKRTVLQSIVAATMVLVICALSANGQTIDMSTWSVVQYEFHNQGDSNWRLDADGLGVTQISNSDGAIFIGDFDSTAQQIEGLWKVGSTSDDDFIGLVFGYQNERQYYLFDWKRTSQSWSNWGLAEQGMSLKVVNLPEGTLPLGPDMWPTAGSENVTVLQHNTIRWQTNTLYTFRLNFDGQGQIRIVVRNGDTNEVMEDWVVNDGTFTSGLFGFYNFSQDNVRYEGFTTTTVEEDRLILAAPFDESVSNLGFRVGWQQPIRWSDEGFVQHVLIEYSTNNGGAWTEVEPNNVGNTGEYLWTVPTADSQQCLIRISDPNNPTVFDISQPFAIFECMLAVRADLTGDCIVDFRDFAIMADEWLLCGNPYDPRCN